MITNIWDEIRLIRRIKKGLWVNTEHRGWIRPELYNTYLGYGFDPIILKRENHGY
tara:strand:- start:240 stop:404 length:165 start_codon:yes stop_codon:yes gene_type:complete